MIPREVGDARAVGTEADVLKPPGAIACFFSGFLLKIVLFG